MDGLIAYILSKGYTNERIASLGNVLNFKGVVETVADLPATGNKTGDVYTVRETGMEYVWVQGTGWTELGQTIGVGKYKTTITGNGTATSFTITHNLNNQDVDVIVYDSTYNKTVVDVVYTSTTAATIIFGTAPAQGETYTVACLSPQGPQGPKGDPGDVSDVKINNVSIVDESGIANIPESTSSASGLMTSAQYTKLEGIATSAQVNVLEGVQVNGTDLAINNKKVNIPIATSSVNGIMTSTQVGKLDGIEANADVTDATNVSSAGAVMYTSQSKTDGEKAQARSNIGAESLGKITIGGTEYTVAISTTDAGQAGYITFVVEA